MPRSYSPWGAPPPHAGLAFSISEAMLCDIDPLRADQKYYNESNQKGNIKMGSKKAVQRSLVKRTIRDLVPKRRKKRTSTKMDEESKGNQRVI